MSIDEEAYYEPTIRETALTEPVQGSPVSVAGQDYAISGGAAQVMWRPKASDDPVAATYLKTVVVKVAGGAGSALTAGVDYSVNLRTGVIIVVGGALTGATHLWASATKNGIDDLQIRQLANRTKYLKSVVDQAVIDIDAIEAALATLTGFVPNGRTIATGDGLSGGGDLSANRTINIALDGGSLSKSGTGLKVSAIDDTMHGVRGGGDRHALATTAAHGFMSSTHKRQVDGLSALRIVGFAALQNGNGANFTLDFSGLSLQTGDVLVVFTGSPATAVSVPGSQGWAQAGSGQIWSSSARAAQAFYKAWGQGPTDDSTPTFTLTTGDYAAFGVVLRGLRITSGNAVLADVDTATTGSATSHSPPTSVVNVAGSVILTFAIHNVQDPSDDYSINFEDDVHLFRPSLLVQHRANNATLDYTLALFLRVATIGGLGSGPLSLNSSSDASSHAFTNLVFEPLTGP